MRRTSILILLTILTTGTAGVLGAWYTAAMAASRALTESGVVKGAQSGEAAANLRPYPVVRADAPPAFANSRRFALYHVESDTFVAEHNADETVPIASTTKIMTSRLAARHLDLDETVTVVREALSIGSTMELRSNETISVRNLLHGLLIVSGNDAANALAHAVGRKLLEDPEAGFAESRDRFVEEMNMEAYRLGLRETLYADPAGLNDDGKSSARDLAKLAALQLEDETFTAIAAKPEATVTDTTGRISHVLRNSNRLVNDFQYLGAAAGKTGYTPAAGHCLVATATRNGTTFVAVILSTYVETKEASAVEARRLLDWGFQNITIQSLPTQ